MQDANKRAMVDVAESVDRLKKGSYASPDAFLSALLLTVAKMNSALLKAAQEMVNHSITMPPHGERGANRCRPCHFALG